MINLYPDQAKLIAQTSEALKSGHNLVLMQAPTGCGKTIMAIHMISKMQEAGRSSWFVVPRKELLRQTSKSYSKFGVAHSYIAAGCDHDPDATCHIVSMQSLRSRLHKVKLPDIVFWDEVHYSGQDMNNAFDLFKERGVKVVGKTATPKRGDGVGMGKWFERLVLGPSMRELIDKKRLSEYKIYAPDIPDLTNVKITAGEYNSGAIDEFWETHGKVLFGNAAKTYLKYANGRLGITFCQSIARSKQTAEIYKAHGIQTAHMDGTMSGEERSEIINAFANKEILQITSVDLMTFGFDLAAQVNKDVTVEVMTDLAATKSESKQLQKWGRVLRMKDEPAQIFDHVGNIIEHGMPCKMREWSLEGREKGSRKASASEEDMSVCPECYYCHDPAPHCPNCGHVYESKKLDIKEIDGDLIEISEEMLEAQKRRKKMEVGQAKTMSDLHQIAQERGYKKGWVFHIAKAKGIKK